MMFGQMQQPIAFFRNISRTLAQSSTSISVSIPISL